MRRDVRVGGELYNQRDGEFWSQEAAKHFEKLKLTETVSEEMDDIVRTTIPSERVIYAVRRGRKERARDSHYATPVLGSTLDDSAFTKLTKTCSDVIKEYPDIFRDNKILLLKRAFTQKQKHPFSHPEHFELPTKALEATELCLAGILGKLMEGKTGVDISSIVGQLAPSEFEIIYVKNGHGVHYNFVVDMECEKITIDKEEYSEAVWASEEEMEELNIMLLSK
jgi:hypothetical protein